MLTSGDILPENPRVVGSIPTLGGCRCIANPGEPLRHPRGRPEPIPRRLLECERDQRTVYVIARRTDLWIECLDEGLDRRRFGRRRPTGDVELGFSCVLTGLS